jgi:AraC-like DNA-binding protein
MLLFLSIFTIVISFVLITFNWRVNNNAIILSLVFILTSLFGIAHYFLVFAHSRFWLAIFYNNFAPFMFLIGPLLYFYVRNTLLDKNSISKKDWIHFIPASIAFIGSIPYLFLPFDKKLQIADRIINNLNAIATIEVNMFYNVGLSFVLRTIVFFLYLVYSVFLVWKVFLAGINCAQVTKKQFMATYRWLVVLLASLGLIAVSFAVLAVNATFSTPSDTIKEGHIIYLIAGLAYSIMSFSFLLFPRILYGIPNKPILNFATNKIISKPKEDPLYELSNKIIAYIEEEKPYLNYGFSISDVSLHLQVPQKNVSYCFTFLMKTKFSKLKNRLRIQHAIQLLTESNLSTLTIESIGEQSGFKTRSNFYIAFKEETGFTPSKYIERFKK